MKAYYNEVLWGKEHGEFNKPEDVLEYELLEMTEPCCPKMAEALNDRVIGFGEFRDCVLNRDCQINLVECCPYPEGAAWYFWPISFCPFCGTPTSTEKRD